MCPTKNNIQCLASRVCLNINSLPFCAAYICTLHLAELLSICVLTQPLDCSICPPLCIWCASLAFHVLLFHILIYIDIYIYIYIYMYVPYVYMYSCMCVCAFVSLLLYWVNFCARHLPCVWNMLIHTRLCVILRLGTWWYLHIPSLVNYTIVKVLNAQKTS
jgi:hypothetical protein